MTTISYPDTTSATYSYDELSRLHTATNSTGTVTIDYDNRGRVDSVTDVFGQVVSYQYDPNSNRTQLKLNGILNVSYQYDLINRLTHLTDSASLDTAFDYDATNKLTSRTLPNGVVSTWDYDGLDRLKRLKHVKGANTLLDLQYQLSDVGNITQLIDSAGTHDFSYDTRDRLTAVTHPSQPNESYTLDDVGNRTASHQGSSYSYQTFNRLVTANTSSFGYDINGNLTAKTDASGSWTYAWDYENRLKQATLSGGVTVNYSYDALGRRIQRSSSATGATKFVYDGADVIRDLDGSGNLLADYLNGPGIDNKLRQIAGGATSYFVADRLGTTRALTDASGALNSSINYDSYGNVSGGSISTRYTYTEREIDSETGMMYFRARWYDPAQGKFISEDPIGLPGGINLFAYVANNPAGFSDPRGFCPQNPMDTTKTEKLLTEDCVHFLNSILAELKDPHSYNFRSIFRKAKDQRPLYTKRMTAEEKKAGYGNTYSRVGDPAFYIYLDEDIFNSDDGFLLIHELFHGAAGSGSGYSHTDMANAAYNAALANPRFLNYINRHGGLNKPRQVNYLRPWNEIKADDWYNSSVFQSIAWTGCVKPIDY